MAYILTRKKEKEHRERETETDRQTGTERQSTQHGDKFREIYSYGLVCLDWAQEQIHGPFCLAGTRVPVRFSARQRGKTVKRQMPQTLQKVCYLIN